MSSVGVEARQSWPVDVTAQRVGTSWHAAGERSSGLRGPPAHQHSRGTHRYLHTESSRLLEASCCNRNWTSLLRLILSTLTRLTRNLLSNPTHPADKDVATRQSQASASLRRNHEQLVEWRRVRTDAREANCYVHEVLLSTEPTYSDMNELTLPPAACPSSPTPQPPLPVRTRQASPYSFPYPT